MLTSLFAAIDFADELKDTNEMETGGRAAYEIRLHDVLEPRETFVDQGGNTRNGIDIGDTVYFRPIIINDGDNAQNEFNIRVTVTPAGDNVPAEIDNLDDAVCPGDIAVTGCSFNTLASGDFLGGGNYRVQAESGGDLAWSPTIPGEYTITVEIDLIDSTQDTDLNNNALSYSVTVEHYNDIVVDLCWTDGPGGDCMAEPSNHDSVNGAGPHNFALSVTADGSEAWQPRSTMVNLLIEDDFDASQSGLDLNDGNGMTLQSTFSVEVGVTTAVHVWHNVSDPEATSTDANDIAANPCANGDNPCTQDRTVMVYQTTYTYHGVVKGDPGADVDPSESTNSFTVTAMLGTFDSFEPAVGATGGGFGTGGEGGDETQSIIMEENTLDYDDRTGNNDGSLSGYFTVFHDVGLTALTGGANEATEGTMNVGVNRLKAMVLFGGSDGENSYDWSVTFTVTDENGGDALNGAPGMANECLDEDPEIDYSHTNLGQMAPALPEGTACLEVDLQQGRYTVSATVEMIGATSTPDTATDMNSGNNQRGTFFEVINDNPNVFMTLDDISRDGASVDAPVVVGDFITMRARGTDSETPAEGLMYSWSRITAGGEAMDMFECDQSVCMVETDMSWIGTHPVTATVTDGNGASATDTMNLAVWNTYSVDMAVTGATMSYSLVYSGGIPYNVSATDGDSYTGVQLGNNAGAFDSVVSIDMDVTHIFGMNDIGAESLTIDFDGDATTPWGLWLKRTVESPWTNIPNAASAASASGGVTMTFSHDGGLQGNLGSGTYAIFDVATAGAEPPATGVTGLTAVAQPSAQVALSWGYGDDSLLNVNADTVNLYWCAGADCDALTGTAMPAMQTTTTSWTLVGTDAEVYTVLVQTENGNTDVVTGATLSGGSASITVTADGSVSPAPTLSNAAAAMTSTDDGLTFTWDAADTDDVSSWQLCWAGTQDIVNNEFDSLLGNSCAETADTTTSITVTEQTMCGGTCNADMYFGIAGQDVVGNVADPGVDLYADMSEGLDIPDVIDGGGDPAGEDAGIGNAVYAIIALVVIAVIGGAYILTRGAEGGEGDKEWDY
jgi:hypothetical protein